MSPGRRHAPAGRDFDFAERRVHGAGVRRREIRPLLAAAVYRHRDSEPDGSIGRAAGQARALLLRAVRAVQTRSEEHTSELQSRQYLVCRLLLEKKKTKK